MPVSPGYIGKDAIGYMINTGLSSEAAAQIKMIQQSAQEVFAGDLWPTPVESLHVTLLDWLAPLVDYHEDKDVLFENIRVSYDKALDDILNDVPKQSVVFNRLLVSPSAIIVVADNAASDFNKIRQAFLSHVNLLPGTKQPPTIVHATIARFTGNYDAEKAESFAQQNNISIPEIINGFRLVRETKLPMLDYTVLKTYPFK